MITSISPYDIWWLAVYNIIKVNLLMITSISPYDQGGFIEGGETWIQTGGTGSSEIFNEVISLFLWST